MPSGLDRDEATRLLTALLGKTPSYTPPTTPMKVKLLTANGDAATAGTEVTGGTYARQNFAPSVSVSNGQIANDAVITFAGMPAATVVGVEIVDNTGRRALYGSLAASKATAAGDSLSFAIGALTLSLANVVA